MPGYKDAQHIYVHREYFRCKRQKAQPKHAHVPRRCEITEGHHRGCPQAHGLCPRENGQVLCQEDQLTLGPRRIPPVAARQWGWGWLQRVPPQYPSQFKSHEIKKSYSSFEFLFLHIQRAISSEKNFRFSIPPLDKWLTSCLGSASLVHLTLLVRVDFWLQLSIWLCHQTVSSGRVTRCARHGTQWWIKDRQGPIPYETPSWWES